MKTMTYEEVRIAFLNHLKTFPALPIEKVLTPNMPIDGKGAFDIPKSGIWSRMSINYGTSFIASVSDKPCTRRVGILTFQLFNSRGRGESELNSIAEQLTEHFQYYKESHLEILSGSLVSSDDDRNWHQVNVNLVFRVG